MNSTISRDAEGLLADAFAAFTVAAGQLECSYQELQKEVLRLRREGRVLDALPCGVIVLGDRREIAFLNPEAARQLDLVVDHVGECRDKAAAAQTLFAQWLSESAHDTAEKEVSFRSGVETRWLAIRSSSIRPSPAARDIPALSPLRGHTVLISRDITAQKQLEQERDATQHFVALAKMSAVLAHEIRNPLASMELLLGLLHGSDPLSGDQHAWIDGLRAGLRALSATVNNVLRYHSMGVSNRSVIQLSQILRESVQFVQPLAKQAEIMLTLNDELSDVRISANAGEIQQVLFNLALNSFRHTPKNGSVRVSARRVARPSGHCAVVEVTDTGSGIRAEDIARVFDAGFTTTGHSPGLGLAVCRKIVEQHEGTISVSSTPGSGCTFRMEFPIA
jgi:two-component system, sensor histidine kinase FlrB